jgi:hypothetical protein
MKIDFKKLPLTSDNTKLFEETNQYHPMEISLEKYDPEKMPYNGFAILIEDFEKGNYTLVNSIHKSGHTANTHFEPFMQQPLKTIEDLNNLVKIFNGKGLTLIKVSRCCGRCDGLNDICHADRTCEKHTETGCEICFGER